MWYAARGFLHAQTASIDTSGDTLFVSVVEGPLALVEAVRIQGSPFEGAAELLKTIEMQPGTVFTQEGAERDIGLVLAQFERSGRLLVRVTVEDLQERLVGDSLWITLSIGIEPGPALRVGAVRFTGNTATRAATLQTASGLHEGDLWMGRSAEIVRRRLLRTQLFTHVGQPQADLGPDQLATITVPVTEGRHNAFDGIIGYLPPPPGGARGSITGLVHLQFRNLLGTARKLSVRWFQERQGTQEIDLTYREPWVLNSPIAAGLAYHQRKQDSLYVRQSYGVDVRGEAAEDMIIGASYARLSTTPQEGYGARVLNGSDQTLVGLSFSYDTRDDAVTPRSGSVYSTDYQTGRKNIGGRGGSSGHTTQRIRFDLGFYVSPLRTHSVLFEGHWSEVRSGALDVSDLGRLGGATDLRGYREGEFLGSRLLWGTLEYRLFLSPRSFLGAFIDAGAVARPALSSIALSSSDLTRFGYGMALRVDAPVGLLSVSIALGKGDGFGEAKLHVRVQNEF